MSYGTSSYGETAYGEEPVGEFVPEIVDLSATIYLVTDQVDLSATIDFDNVPISATIDLDTRNYAYLFAVVDIRLTEQVDLTATINLRTDYVVDLTATIDYNAGETVDLAATISLQTASQVLADDPVGYWTLVATIDGTDVSAQLTGAASVEYEEDASGLATFTIVPPDGAFLLTDYVGKYVSLTYQSLDSAGLLLYERTLFVGYISDPYFDPDAGRLQLECTTDLQGALDAMPRENIDALISGSWSPIVFEEGAQGYVYATDQLRTRPAAMWHSPGGIVVTDWAAKTTADIEFTDDQVIEESITYENATRRDLLNKVQITFDYRFQRLRQRTLNCIFTMRQTFCDLLINGFKICQRSMVESAASGGGWYLQGSIYFEPLPPPGYYRCFPFAAGPGAAKYIGWGQLQLGALVEDPDNDALCWGATWRAGKRWAQTVTERYSIVIQAPQSQAGNGDIVSTESYSLTSAQDSTDWLEEEDFAGLGKDSAEFSGVGGNITAGDGTILGDVARDATDDLATGRAAADLARQVMIEAGVTDTLRAHRASSVTFQSVFQPFVDLTRTVRLNTTEVQAKGKVRRVLYAFGIETGSEVTEIELALSRHFGTGLVTSSPQTPDPEPDKPEEEGIPTTKGLGSYVGGLTTTVPLVESWEGYFTNYTYDPTNSQPFAVNPTNPQATIYPEQFVVNYPEVSGAALDTLELPAEQTIDVEVPLDELTLVQ